MPGLNPFARQRKRASAPKRLFAPAPAFCPARAVAGLSDLPSGERLVRTRPPRELSTNHRIHGAKKARFVRDYREACWALALERFGCAQAVLPAEGKLAVHLDFFPPNGNRRDDDNCEAAFKAGRDGVAGALRIDDSRFVVTRTLRAERRGCVVMTFLGAPT